ncbi:MAG: Rnf-Nqr domain containing protein [Acutalibacteraceae bacterium]|nr:Rnf-Nqr domain containing protein [Acutalibacteraceae bacterium]
MNKSPSFKDIFLKNAVIFNPVLIQLAGLCPVVAASTNLKSAVMLSAVALAELIAVSVIASALLKKLPRWVRVPLYFVIGLVLICPALWYVETQTLAALSMSMKIFIPLIAINSVVAVHCEQFAVKNDVKTAFFSSVAAGIGASVVFIVAGALREIIGLSSLGGIELNLPVAFRGMTLPFGCLILLGFMSAALKTFISKKYPEYSVTHSSVAAKPADEKPEKEDVPAQQPEEVSQAVEEKIPDPVQVESVEDIKIRTEEEIEEFFKSLGLDFGEKGDEE